MTLLNWKAILATAANIILYKHNPKIYYHNNIGGKACMNINTTPDQLTFYHIRSQPFLLSHGQFYYVLTYAQQVLLLVLPTDTLSNYPTQKDDT